MYNIDIDDRVNSNERYCLHDCLDVIYFDRLRVDQSAAFYIANSPLDVQVAFRDIR